MYTITCPYCFENFDDSDVKFRSEFVFQKELDELDNKYEIQEAKLFAKQEHGSHIYEMWWTVNGGFTTSEMDPADSDIRPYQRPVIDPASQAWQSYLVAVGSSEDYKQKYLIRDNDGMVAHIKLKATSLHSEVTCSRRVCPKCHNPLPEHFGKTQVVTIPIIGVMGSGKTVYMSSLLKNISYYVENIGYNGASPTNGVFSFTHFNKVENGQKLPSPTSPELVQQPLCFVMYKNLAGNKLASYTVVLYDLAGEYFNSDPKQDIRVEEKHRKKLLKHANGIILLIDPSQLTGRDEKNLAVAALENIQAVLLEGSKVGKLSTTPIAICIPKADDIEFLKMFGTEIQSLAMQSAEYDMDVPKIPAEQYNELNDKLLENMKMNHVNGVMSRMRNFEMSRFFAFSAVNGDLIRDGVLTGRPFPQRIEDPLLWLLAKNGYCDVDGRLNNDVKCPNPNCGSYYTRYDEHVEPGERRLFRRMPDIKTDHICMKCKTRFNVNNG